MVSCGAGDPVHARFTDLPAFLEPGDVLVINTSATIPAAIDARGADGSQLRLHLSGRLPGGIWMVEARLPRGAASTPFDGDLRGTMLTLPGGGRADLWRHLPGSTRLWLAEVSLPGGLIDYTRRWGRPIRYPYVDVEWPIDAYQTVYATEPGSAEMPSAGRPFSAELVTRLAAAGVGLAPLVLHTGVSSQEGEERPYPEWYSVPASTAGWVNQARAAGRRVVAVGTTVVRALESAGEGGAVHAGSGWTELVVTAERGISTVDGLLTGLHDPRATHLEMLEAIAGRPALEQAYAAAAGEGYLWHEFGDSHLLLRDPCSPSEPGQPR
jgi:S-adenosylmethionine:tRNA ribosyltransferase-isomerase